MPKVFIVETTNGESRGDYPGIDKAIASNHKSQVTIEDFAKVEISDAQRSWLHCEAGPIQELMRAGWSFREAKEHVKVEYGRQWFVVDLTPENFNKIDGVFRWECRKSLCRKLIHPIGVKFAHSEDGVTPDMRICPYCQSLDSLHPIAIKSIMDLSVKKTNMWFNEIFAHMPNILQPDPDWDKKPSKRPDGESR